MEPKRNEVSKNEGSRLGITLPSLEDRNRFNDICAKEDKTQHEMLIMLMDLYDQQLSSDKKIGKITLSMFVYSGSRKTQRRTISFQGQTQFLSNWSTLCPLDEITAAKLSKDFGCPVGDGSRHLYSHCMNLYYDVNRRCYLIHEGIYVTAKYEFAWQVAEGEIFEYPLEVSRCKYVNSFDEAYACFSRYATPYELNGISQFLAADIGDDYAEMDSYFDDIAFFD